MQELYDKASAKHAKILEQIKDNPAAFTKQAVCAAIELGIIHKVHKHLKNSKTFPKSEQAG